MIVFFSKLMTKKVRITLYMISPERQIPKFLPEITRNIGIMEITSQFEPFYDAK